MANKKRVEGEGVPNLGNIHLEPEEHLVEVPKQEPKVEETPQPATLGGQAASEPINCLRNERVVVRFVPSPNAMVQGKGHVLSGGMAENATRSFVVPKLSSGQYKNVLTNNEKAFLEKAMGLEKDALSIYRKKDNFWDDSNPEGIGKVTLRKQDNYLDLSIPSDYIKYKVLLANTNFICPSLQELRDRRKATYQFVIVSENAEAQMSLSKNETKMECYVEYGAIRNDIDTLRIVLELLTGRPLAPNSKLPFLQGKVMEYIDSDPRKFYGIIKDELLPAKILVKKAVDAGLVQVRSDLYFIDGTPMCEAGEDSTLTNAAKYITNIKRTELKYSLEARIKG